MNNISPSFTPVRRRDYYTHSQKPEKDDSNSWTASRCNRLLRPLISRIAALQRTASISTLESKAEAYINSTTSAVTDEVILPETSESDDEWAPARKRARRTYSKQCSKKKGTNGKLRKSKDQSIQLPGEYILPTPVLDRVAYQERLSTEEASDLGSNQPNLFKNIKKRPISRYLTSDGAAHFQLAEDLRAIKRTTNPDIYRAYEGIFHSLEILLKTTAPVQTPQKMGPESLLSICLRRVPKYIAEEKCWEKEKAGDNGAISAFDVDRVSTEIYSELEDFGLATNGCKHLRTVVRSHGIFQIREAIQNGLLDARFSAALVDLCIHMKSEVEAEGILSTLLNAKYPAPQHVNSAWSQGEALSALSVLDKFADYTGRRPFQYRILSELFLTGLLPVAWLATKPFGPIWTRAFQLASHEHYEQEATNFITTVIPLLCEAPEVAEEELDLVIGDSDLSRASVATLTSVLATISAIIILRRGPAELQAEGTDRFTRALRACVFQLWTTPSESCPERTLILIIANMLAQPDSFEPLRRQFTKLMRNLSNKAVVGRLSTFLVSTARCCRRATQSEDLGCLENLHSILRNCQCFFPTEKSSILGEVLIASSSMMSKHDARYSKYAKSLKAEFYNIEEDLRVVSAGGEGESSFRWEEGISEWVTATPALPPVARNYQRFNDSEETPIRPKAGRPKKQSLLRRMHMTPSRPPPRRSADVSDDRDHLVASSPVEHNPFSRLTAERQGGAIATGRKPFDDLTSDSLNRLQTVHLTGPSSIHSAPSPKAGLKRLSMIVDDSDDELNSSGLTFDHSEDDMDTSSVSMGSKRPFTLCTRTERRRRSGRITDSEDELGF